MKGVQCKTTNRCIFNIYHILLMMYVIFETADFVTVSSTHPQLLHNLQFSPCRLILVPASPKQIMEEIQCAQHAHQPVKPLQMVMVQVFP